MVPAGEREGTIDCDSLTGRKRAICEGTSGLSEEKRQTYLTRWFSPKKQQRRKCQPAAETDNPYGPNDRGRPCWARWMALGERACDTCGHKGELKTIYFCAAGRGECFEGLGGFRDRKAEPCRYCDDYRPEE